MAEPSIRIDRPTFVGTSVALLIACIFVSGARFFIRFRIHKEIGWDDGFLLFGLCCAICAFIVLFLVVDTMYTLEEMLLGIADSIPVDVMAQSLRFKRFNAAGLTLMWFSICSVKFSFLALFKRLIHQMPYMIRYWWFVVVFNAMVSTYGATVYWVACPYFSEDQIYEALHCVTGSMLAKTMSICISQMVLDIAGDLFILVIPFYLIWRIRIRWSQKLMLFLSLCLTIVMIILTIARAVGIKADEKLDAIWETFFMIISAEVGLALAAIAAFRAFFVARVKERQNRQLEGSGSWYSRSKIRIRHLISRFTGSTASGSSSDELKAAPKAAGFFAHNVPGATMTGIRSFIGKNGRMSLDSGSHSNEDHIATLVEEHDAFWPYPDRVYDGNTIKMQRDVIVTSTRR